MSFITLTQDPGGKLVHIAISSIVAIQERFDGCTVVYALNSWQFFVQEPADEIAASVRAHNRHISPPQLPR